MYVSINGELVEEHQASISVFDHGFLYGIGLFETFAVRKNGIFLLENHLERLKEGLLSVGIEYGISPKDVYETTNALLEANGKKEGYIRWNVSAGERELGLFPEPYTNPQTIVFMKELPTPPISKELVSLKLKRNTPEGLKRFKSHHYLNNVLGKQELGVTRAEGLFFTREGYVAEGIVSNVFWKTKNRIYTPDLSTGILDGVTRSFVIKLIHTLGYEVEQGLFSEKDLQQADELFVTNAIQGVVPVSSYNGRKYESQNFARVVSTAYQAYVIEGE